MEFLEFLEFLEMRAPRGVTLLRRVLEPFI
jgi:hypothetical protein